MNKTKKLKLFRKRPIDLRAAILFIAVGIIGLVGLRISLGAPASTSDPSATGRIIVQYKADAPIQSVNDIIRAAGGTELSDTPSIRLKVVKVDPDKQVSALKILTASPYIASASSDAVTVSTKGAIKSANQASVKALASSTVTPRRYAQ